MREREMKEWILRECERMREKEREGGKRDDRKKRKGELKEWMQRECERERERERERRRRTRTRRRRRDGYTVR